MTDEVRNVIIIGSGPAGYTAGLYSARALLEPLMFAGYMSGGQLMLTSDIENFPGYPEGIGGPEMMIQLREQAEKFGLEVQDKNVERVDFSGKTIQGLGRRRRISFKICDYLHRSRINLARSRGGRRAKR
jgi:thioredoxin reductase (NADPH)